MRKAVIISISCAAIALMAGIGIYSIMTEDRTGPEIVFEGEDVTYEQGGDRKVLLRGVRATDSRDGDVTDTLMIESVIPFTDGATAKIIYAAKDESNNITKCSRIVSYIGTGMVEDLTKEETREETEEEAAEEKKEEQKDAGKPVVVLTDKEITLKKGGTFNYMNYIETMTDDKDDRKTLARNIRVNGDAVDMGTAGRYEVLISVVDSDKKRSEAELLIVNVVK